MSTLSLLSHCSSTYPESLGTSHFRVITVLHIVATIKKQPYKRFTGKYQPHGLSPKQGILIQVPYVQIQTLLEQKKKKKYYGRKHIFNVSGSHFHRVVAETLSLSNQSEPRTLKNFLEAQKSFSFFFFFATIKTQVLTGPLANSSLLVKYTNTKHWKSLRFFLYNK